MPAATEISAYQRKKRVVDAVNKWDKGEKAIAFELLLGEWAEQLPKASKATERLEWLQEHWGTQFEVTRKGVMKKALRKATLEGVLELLTLFCLNAADSEDEELTFGSLELPPGEDGPEAVSDKVASGLSALKQASGPVVQIPLAAYRELQRLRKEAEGAGADPARTNTSVLKTIDDILRSMPSVKDEKETRVYQKRRAAYDKRKAEQTAGASN